MQRQYPLAKAPVDVQASVIQTDVFTLSQPDQGWYLKRAQVPVVTQNQGATIQATFPVPPTSQPVFDYYKPRTIGTPQVVIPGPTVQQTSPVPPVSQPVFDYYKPRTIGTPQAVIPGATVQQTFPVPPVSQPIFDYYTPRTIGTPQPVIPGPTVQETFVFQTNEPELNRYLALQRNRFQPRETQQLDQVAPVVSDFVPSLFVPQRADVPYQIVTNAFLDYGPSVAQVVPLERKLRTAILAFPELMALLTNGVYAVQLPQGLLAGAPPLRTLTIQRVSTSRLSTNNNTGTINPLERARIQFTAYCKGASSQMDALRVLAALVDFLQVFCATVNVSPWVSPPTAPAQFPNFVVNEFVTVYPNTQPPLSLGVLEALIYNREDL